MRAHGLVNLPHGLGEKTLAREASRSAELQTARLESVERRIVQSHAQRIEEKAGVGFGAEQAIQACEPGTDFFGLMPEPRDPGLEVGDLFIKSRPDPEKSVRRLAQPLFHQGVAPFIQKSHAPSPPIRIYTDSIRALRP